MLSSHQWQQYFERNARSLQPIPWDLGAELTAEERAWIGPSVQDFQLGESSGGHELLRYATAYAHAVGDDALVSAIRLFIAEEQRHARELAHFLQLNDIPLAQTSFRDRAFRALRHLLGKLELSLAVLLTAEIIANVYYAALREASQSRVLRCLCDQILRDEAEHVVFHAEQLGWLRSRRSRLSQFFTVALQRFLLLNTCVFVWLFHRHVLRRGGLDFRQYWRSCWLLFRRAVAISNVVACICSPSGPSLRIHSSLLDVKP